MTIAELMHGRGTPMSAHEYAVVWPAFYACRERMEQREQSPQNRATRRARR